MDRWTDEQLDAALGAYLASALDPQRGRAAERFGHMLAAEPPTPRVLPRVLTLAAGGIITAAAAALALAATILPRQSYGPARPVSSAQDPWPQTTDVLYWRNLDEGTVLLDDNTPARRVRRQVLQQVQWYDPASNAEVEITVPGEEVVLVGMPSY